MVAIDDIRATEIQDSRAHPTLRVSVSAGGQTGVFDVPSGASTGSREAAVLRDADGHMNSAVKSIEERIRPILLGRDVAQQQDLDRAMIELDGTREKSQLGGNAMIGVSIAIAKTAALSAGIQTHEYLRSLASIPASRAVPLLYMNYINGGKHAQSPLAFQEHMIVPQTDSIVEALDMARRVDSALSEIITSQYGEAVSQSMGDEGGYVLPSADIDAPFELLIHAVESAGLTDRIRFAIDAAANSFFENDAYRVGGNSLNTAELQALYVRLAARFPILSIEDPYEEDAIDAFAALQHESAAIIVGDDLTVTSANSIKEAGEKQAIRGVIIKPNQVGTLSETIAAIAQARTSNIDCIISHRSGETRDDFVADLAYAFGCFGLKAGSLRKPERVIKYERLRSIAV